MHTSSGKKTQPSASCISASLRRALSIPCRQEFGCAAARILCHFCASTLAEQPASGCPTCLSVHCRAIFVLHRQAGTAGTNHCPCLQITRANKAPAGTRTSSPENSPRSTVPAVQCVSEEPWLALGLQRQLWSRGCTTAHASSSKPSARGMLCPAGLLLVHKHAATANATQSQRGYLPRQTRGAAGELQGEEERNWSHGCSLLLDFSPK